MGMAKFACRWQAAERVEVRLKETTVGSEIIQACLSDDDPVDNHQF
jgi:hypothetical protein